MPFVASSPLSPNTEPGHQGTGVSKRQLVDGELECGLAKALDPSLRALQVLLEKTLVSN